MIRTMLLAGLRRKRTRLVLLVTSSLGVFVLTALQLRVAHEYLVQSVRVDHRFTSLSIKNRRMQQHQQREQHVVPQYLAFSSQSSPDDDVPSRDPVWYDQVATGMRAVLVHAASRGSAWSAACTQTIVTTAQQQQQQPEFDVITVEFSVWDSNVAMVARRLRTRYPNAVMVLVQVWNTTMLRYKSRDGTTTSSIDISTWKKQNNWDAADWHSLALAQAMSASGPDQWFLPPDPNETSLDDTARAVDAAIVTLSRPDARVWAVPETVVDYLSWFQPTTTTTTTDDARHHPTRLSPAGHAALAQLLLVTALPQVQSRRRSRDRRTTTDLVGGGSWGSGDACNLWFATGDLGSVVGGDGGVVDFAHDNTDDATTDRHKHALEFRHLRGDQVTVHNPFDTERMLYLTYMTASEDGDYPRTRIKLNGLPTVQIDPFHDDERRTDQELARTTAVGKIPPRASTQVRLDPLQRSARHFRLVGASLIADEMSNVPIEFSLEAESVKQERPSHAWSFW
jgi:hypothetical protein